VCESCVAQVFGVDAFKVLDDLERTLQERPAPRRLDDYHGSAVGVGRSSLDVAGQFQGCDLLAGGLAGDPGAPGECRYRRPVGIEVGQQVGVSEGDVGVSALVNTFECRRRLRTARPQKQAVQGLVPPGPEGGDVRQRWANDYATSLTK
jgi:hypothetical protein